MKLLLWCLPLLCWAQSATHFADLVQLTHGGQNAEAYWSPDGKRLIFQSTRDGRECDQMYIMNADGSDGLRCRGHGELEKEHDGVHVARLRRSGAVDHED